MRFYKFAHIALCPNSSGLTFLFLCVSVWLVVCTCLVSTPPPPVHSTLPPGWAPTLPAGPHRQCPGDCPQNVTSAFLADARFPSLGFVPLLDHKPPQGLEVRVCGFKHCKHHPEALGSLPSWTVSTVSSFGGSRTPRLLQHSFVLGSCFGFFSALVTKIPLHFLL